MWQYLSTKLMTTLMVDGTDRARHLQDLVFMVYRKDLGAGVVSGLHPCVFLQMLLDLPREITWKMGPIKSMEEFDPVFFQETFRFSQGEFTEILSIIRDMDVDLLVDTFFADFPTHLEQLGAPFENLIYFVDGKLVPTTRPGGNDCVFLNLHDFQTYSGLHRRHGYSYQGLESL
jgi:hypothetical protein